MAMVNPNPNKHKTISPYDLSTNDNPGAVISQPLLNGSNYDEWALNLRIALSSRKKFGFLDGTIPKPGTDDENHEDWIANNHLLVGWIKLTIDPKLRSTISTREYAKEYWDVIKRRFSMKSGARFQQLRNALATCKQDGSTVDDYFGRLTKLWDGIADCTTTKRCSCGKCECDLNTARDEELNNLKVHDFLAGLDENIHGTIRSQLCSLSPLPDLDTVYQTVLQNETIKSSSNKTDLMSFASQVTSSKSSKPQTDASRVNRDPTRFCTVCNRNGHEATACFKVVGYPDWWEDRSRSKQDSRRGRGRGRGSQPRANVSKITTANSVTAQTSAPLTEADRQGLSGLTDGQWKTVQRLLAIKPAPERLSGKKTNDFWILDTGATHHMTDDDKHLHDIRNIPPVSVRLPAGEDVVASQQGTVYLTDCLKLLNVYLVPGFHTNLISFGQLVSDNYLVGQITDRLLILQDRTTRTLIGVGDREGEGLYRFRGIETMASNHTSVQKQFALWHMRLGHPSSRVLGNISGIRNLSSESSENFHKRCDICFRAKQTRQSFPDSNNNAKEIFDLIHCDLWGPYRTQSFCGSRYFLTIVDDRSRAVWLYLLSDKTTVSTTLRNFLAMIERQFSKKIKTIRSDNGTEFLVMTKYLQEQGIIHETSCVYTPQQNGRVERKHRNILEVARALRFQGKLSTDFWGECVLTAAYLINRTPNQVLQGKTPFEILYGHAPGYKHLRTFGCLAYAHNLDHKGDKFESRSRRCVLVGYPYAKKGWRLYDLERGVFCWELPGRF